MPGTVTTTIWLMSSMSSWVTSTLPFRSRFSNTTSWVPSSRSRESKAKVTLTVPCAASGVKVVSAVTVLPPTSRGVATGLPSFSPFTCMEPLRVYSLPGTRLWYSTVSTMTVSLSVTTFLSLSMPSSAVVAILGFLMVTV